MKADQQPTVVWLRSLLCDVMKEKEFLYTENEILIIYNSEMHNITQLKSVKKLILHNDCVSNSVTSMSKIQAV